MTKFRELWHKIKNLFEKINDEPGKYEKHFMKIKFNSDEILKIYNMAIVVKSVFQRGNKYYPQVFLDECFPIDTFSSIRHRFDVEIPHGEFVEISSILKGESTWKL